MPSLQSAFSQLFLILMLVPLGVRADMVQRGNLNREVVASDDLIQGYVTGAPSEMKTEIQPYTLQPSDEMILVGQRVSTDETLSTSTYSITQSAQQSLIGHIFWFTGPVEKAPSFHNVMNSQLAQDQLQRAQNLKDQLQLQQETEFMDPSFFGAEGGLIFASHHKTAGIKAGSMWNPLCHNFINESGNYGAYGQFLARKIQKQTEFFDHKVIHHIASSGLCPNFKSFTKSKQIHFYVFLFADMAMGESYCDATLVNRDGTNGTAYGLLQVGQSRQERIGYDCGTGFNAANGFENLSCGVNILARQLDLRSEVQTRKSYWQVLIPGTAAYDGGRGSPGTFQRIRDYWACTN
jgi:hypothetical protein